MLSSGAQGPADSAAYHSHEGQAGQPAGRGPKAVSENRLQQGFAAFPGALASSPGAREAKPVPGWFAVPAVCKTPDTAEAPAKPLRTAGSRRTSA
jgi:hypothetical protein